MTRISDEQLKEKIFRILHDDLEQDFSQVEIEVLDGSLFLRGSVESESTKRKVEDSLSDIFGLHKIFNELTVIQIESEMDVSIAITNDLERDEQFRAEKLP